MAITIYGTPCVGGGITSIDSFGETKQLIKQYNSIIVVKYDEVREFIIRNEIDLALITET